MITIKKLNETTYEMKDGDKISKITLEPGKDYLKLPENSQGRKFAQISLFKDSNVVELKAINRTNNPKTRAGKHAYNWEDFLNDEELAQLEKLKKSAESRIELEKKKLDDPKYKELMATKKKFDELIAINYISEESEDYKKLLTLIKNFKA